MKSVEGNIKKFYWFSFLNELMFIIPVIVLFWQENGLSLTEIMFLQSLFAISIVILEVPTGVVADKWGRKESLVLGALFLMLGSLVYALGSNFWQFAGAEFVWAIGVTFVSGADSAFVYDSLKQEKKEKDFKKVFGNSKSFGYLAAGLASIIGGFVAVYSLRLNWWLEVGVIGLGFLVALSFIEPKHFKKIEKKKHYLKHTMESFSETFRNRPLLFLVLFHALFASISRISLWFYQPYMVESGLNIVYFGIVWASFSFFAIGGSKFAHNLEAKLGQRGSLWLIIFSMIGSVLLMSHWFFIFGISFIFIQQFVRGFGPPVLQDYTHNLLSSDKRATLLSIQSLVGALGFAIVGPIFGWFADTYSLSNSLMIAGISFLIAFGLLMVWGRKLK
jgi:MFS family permease